MLEQKSESPSPAGSPRSRARRLLLPALLLLAYAGQCIWFIRAQSFTLDEPAHIAAGIAAWRYGRFVIQSDNPPLVRKFATAPLYLSTNVDVDNHQLIPSALPINLRPVHAWYVRLPIVFLGLILGTAIWLTTAKLFSESAATFALALFAFSPGMIAHFSVLTTDGGGTLGVFLAAIVFAVWVNAPTWRNAVLLGLAVGFLLMGKFYGAPLTLVLLLLMCVEALRRRKWRVIQHAAVVCSIAFVIVWSGYNLHVARFQFTNGVMDAHFQHRERDWVTPVPFKSSFTLYVPAGDYLDGCKQVYQHTKGWHNAYLLGKKSVNGFRSYHLFAILLKWPTFVLLLGAIGSIAAARKRIRLSRGAALALILPVSFFLITIPSQLQIGDRHVLPLYPFLLVLAGAAWYCFRDSGKMLTLLAVLAVANAVDVSRYAPDYLSYFTPLVKPTYTWKYLADSNLDWGQGLIALKQYQDQHPGETLYVRNFGGFDPAFYGIRYKTFSEHERPHGTVVISANEMAGYFFDDPNTMQWLWQYPMKAHLNHTLFVFQVN